MVNEDPFDGNVRVKVKIEPCEDMKRAESVLGKNETSLQTGREKRVKEEFRGNVKAEPMIEGAESNAPL